MTLVELGEVEKTAKELIKLARKRGFYEHRIKPRELVERIDYSFDDLSLCAAVG